MVTVHQRDCSGNTLPGNLIASTPQTNAYMLTWEDTTYHANCALNRSVWTVSGSNPASGFSPLPQPGWRTRMLPVVSGCKPIYIRHGMWMAGTPETARLTTRPGGPASTSLSILPEPSQPVTPKKLSGLLLLLLPVKASSTGMQVVTLPDHCSRMASLSPRQ